MKRIAIIILLILTAQDLFAQRIRGDYFNRPQVGLWFGPAAPLFEVSEEVDSALAGGAYAKVSTFYNPVKIGLDLSYQHHLSASLTSIKMVPIYSTLQYRLPFNTPINFVVKGGGGATRIWFEPDMVSQWDLTFVGGFEVSFPLGRWINVGMRTDYLMLYEKHLEGSDLNGHFFNVGLSLFFNL
ncbi:MAG: hypothetical protein JXK07_05635 [Spirochaetes bacterium]|nr:hypothetical protein [Spirochaetota bacterium]MBN2769154.1 hypothetical protein [Spirochaetota bacterium]